jgi:hypothetical protein
MVSRRSKAELNAFTQVFPSVLSRNVTRDIEYGILKNNA